MRTLLASLSLAFIPQGGLNEVLDCRRYGLRFRRVARFRGDDEMHLGQLDEVDDDVPK